MAAEEITFHTQGPIPPDLAHLYIPRSCDQEVEKLLERREYISVIGPRLSGKSSLLMRQWERLRTGSSYFVPVYIPLGSIYSQPASDWFGHMHRAVLQQTNNRLPTPPVLAMHGAALEDAIINALENELSGCTLIIMLDQVELTPPEVATDFFSTIREMYVERYRCPPLRNLCFVLAGRFIPDDLIPDDKVSPFRISTAVHMADATREEIKPLVGQLASDVRTVEENISGRIYEWTEGDVYLTHKLCAALAREISEGAILIPEVDRVARKYLYEDSIFRLMWRTIQADTDVFELIDTLLTRRERVRFTLLRHSIMTAWLEGAIKEDTTGNCVLHSLVHATVLDTMRSTVAERSSQRMRSSNFAGERALLRNRYMVEHVINPGTTTNVFGGTDTETDHTVAIKQLIVTRERNEIVWYRFQREIEALRRLDHPHIVRLIDAFSENELEYIVMEYIHGGSLHDRLNREGRLPLRLALDITLAIADALQYAHQHNIIHRDVKPSNIMLTSELVPKLADFGVALLNDHSQVPLLKTTSGTVIGTVPYLSPEGCQGQPLSEYTDIWSLGVTLYEMLTGLRPFSGATDPLVMRAIIETDAPSICTIRPHVPQPIIVLVNRMLTKSLQNRIASCAEVCEEIQRILPAV